jgi:uncharacterized phage-like protein YoqJ
MILNIKEMTCCFTGHREIPLAQRSAIEKRLEAETEKLICKGVIYFGTGGALGFDTMAALTVLKLRITYPQIKLILILPCKEQAGKWSHADKKLYKEILYKADKIRYTCEQYTKSCMYIRNRHLVDHSGYCICYLAHEGGGTAYTVSYAKKRQLEIINLA